MITNVKKYIFTAGVLFLAPAVAFAQPTDLFGVIALVFELLAALIPVVFTLAVIGFLWGGAVFIFRSDDATKREEGRKFMLYGIIALFVMVAIWGLVALLGDTFGVDTGRVPFLPGLREGVQSSDELQQLPIFQQGTEELFEPPDFRN